MSILYEFYEMLSCRTQDQKDSGTLKSTYTKNKIVTQTDSSKTQGHRHRKFSFFRERKYMKKCQIYNKLFKNTQGERGRETLHPLVHFLNGFIG